MPSHSSATQNRLNSITACLQATVDTTVKQNKDECTLLLMQTLVVLHAIIAICVNSDTQGTLSPSMLGHIGDFILTFHKIHTFVEAQQGGNRIKTLLRLSEMNTLLKNCKTGLRNAIYVFKVNAADLVKDINKMQKNAMERHQEVLDLIASLSDTANSETSSLSRVLSSSFNSSTSFSMLPSMPQIFHGRESELSDILQLFTHDAPRIAILGAGGMGKTSLARAVLHHPDITLKYGECRMFVACDVASTMAELVTLIANYLGPETDKNPKQQIMHYFASRPRLCLYWITWRLLGSQLCLARKLKNFYVFSQTSNTLLSQCEEQSDLLEFVGLALFYNPCEMHDSEAIQKILHLTDNMPLAIDLMANLVDSEGCQNILSRWDTEKTSLVSDGYDQRSNLDMSIAMSLSSPRVASVSGAKDLLSLLSMLPDGLSDMELRQSNFPIDNILECKATLLRTSLAYSTSQKRLKVLVPIQEHMQRYHPVVLDIVEPLFQKYGEILELYKKYRGTTRAEIIPQITMNFANIQSILSFRIQQEQFDHSQTINCAIYFLSYNYSMRTRTMTPLMDLVASRLPKPVDHRLEVCFITELLLAERFKKHPRAEALIEQALGHFLHFNDSDVKCLFFNSVGIYYRHRHDLTFATEFHEKALHLSVSTGQARQQSASLAMLAWIKWQLGDYLAGKALACESQRVAQLSADLLTEAGALDAEAACLNELGSYPKAIAQLERAQSLLALGGMAGCPTAQDVIKGMGLVYHAKSEYIQARDSMTRILYCAVEQVTYNVAMAYVNLADIDILLDAPIHDVQKKIDTARSIWQKLGHNWGFSMCDMAQANLYLRERNMSAAKQNLEKNLKLTLGKSYTG
ncbi:hypothetical protein GGX14DRAFT_403652 [Mycena pura]|uniref:NB-ARC domain-containing protein n=1 Tax=Mycena pura TaxID=153505 RepID=A0AAD6UZT4_9AGAR|nr:hypothetical protein GGX14DRAFT_403652 [Mycena pura]